MENKEQISRWLNDELTARELAAFKKTTDYHSYKDIVEKSAKFRRPEFDEEQGLTQLKRKMASGHDRRVRKLNSFPYYKIAAVLLVLIASGLFLWLNSPKTVRTGYSEMAILELPDESKVHLNADSRIEYKPSKWQRQRILKLEGEAFFEVEKGSTFTVDTDHGKVSVLGTKFNVKERQDYFEVRCYEGAVQVTIDKKEFILRKGQAAKVLGGQLQSISILERPVPGWTIEESDFEAVPLRHVLAELERQFSLQIETRNIDLDQLFTGSFSHTNKNVALQAVTVPLQLNFHFETDKKVILYEE